MRRKSEKKENRKRRKSRTTQFLRNLSAKFPGSEWIWTSPAVYYRLIKTSFICPFQYSLHYYSYFFACVLATGNGIINGIGLYWIVNGTVVLALVLMVVVFTSPGLIS
jgi:hypothetical protein